MNSWNGLRTRKIYEMNFDQKERVCGIESRRNIAEQERNCDSLGEENSSTRLNEKLRIRQNDSVNNRVLRNAHKYAFMGHIVVYVVTTKMGHLITVFCNILIPGGQV